MTIRQPQEILGLDYQKILEPTVDEKLSQIIEIMQNEASRLKAVYTKTSKPIIDEATAILKPDEREVFNGTLNTYINIRSKTSGLHLQNAWNHNLEGQTEVARQDLETFTNVLEWLEPELSDPQQVLHGLEQRIQEETQRATATQGQLTHPTSTKSDKEVELGKILNITQRVIGNLPQTTN
jgi:hypothetical protein